ncbi:MAG: T9SS type A sorting domain-containing protein, partial [Chitinophagaceae bacterium]
VFIRDHHGDDSTVFASGSNKNGMSPAAWSCPSSQGVPDKNDILDMFMHVRRDGPNTADSLWLFGGVSLEGTGGNRYFDFEMYQTDIYYERSTLSFKGFGPDEGHTSWLFDAAGNVTKSGDIIFTAEYDNSTLSLVEARIWVNNASLSLVPADFNWGGDFVGASGSATFGYANIVPKTTGSFYTGIQNSMNTWAGPFGLVRANNAVVTDYTPKQFMEFSVNLSKLGLDPLVSVGDPCLMPFRRILVKSRASTSFSAELKDFVGPFDFFRAPMAAASADIPFYCGTNGVSVVSVNNPLVTSLYTWSTADGHIVGDSVGTSITVNRAGSYIVSQQLMDSCGTSYARDTVSIFLDPGCMVLASSLSRFDLAMGREKAGLSWNIDLPASVYFYDVERSRDGRIFSLLSRQYQSGVEDSVYKYSDDISFLTAGPVYYRIRTVDKGGRSVYSVVLRDYLGETKKSVIVAPNPVLRNTSLFIRGVDGEAAQISLYDLSGRCVQKIAAVTIRDGLAVARVKINDNVRSGTYIARVMVGNKLYSEKMIVQ